ncbi:hypothetical protein J6590_034793 [Homalodisca vitripennis]|nr:hypothetical protein J6590_034793 [Homalodisca vitripennis]
MPVISLSQVVQKQSCAVTRTRQTHSPARHALTVRHVHPPLSRHLHRRLYSHVNTPRMWVGAGPEYCSSDDVDVRRKENSRLGAGYCAGGRGGGRGSSRI